MQLMGNLLRSYMTLIEKIIAYHGTGDRFDAFKDGYVAGNFFTQDKEYAKGYVGGKTPLSLIDKPKKRYNYLLTVELDIHHPLDTKHDAEAVAFYNDVFRPVINAIHRKYHKPEVPPIDLGKYVSFVDADALWRYLTRYDSPYDAILVDENVSAEPGIVPLRASQIKILKREIIK